MAPWRIAVGVGLVVVLAVATGLAVMSSSSGGPPTDPSPIAAAPTATATPTVEPDPMPQLHNTGDDFDKIIRSIEEFRSWLYRNPQPELTGRIYSTDCSCFEDLRNRLSQLVDEGAHFSENETIVHEVTLLDREDGAVALRVVDEGKPRVVVDGRTGEVIDTSRGWDRRAYRFLLVAENATWMVRDILEMEAPSAPEGGGV